ncbi:MAG: antibiotic biosynthesis monooxygenase [Bacteroidia bacterium]
MIAETPKPPYYAVIFTNTRTNVDNGYYKTAELMEELAKDQPGYLGLESAREEVGITISYWKDLESIRAWKANAKHKAAQEIGKKEWYKSYKTRIALVERDYEF